jgi:hypothetical protein
LDGPLPKWCPAVALSRQDGRHSAVALLLKAALIQVSNYRLLGASGFWVLRFPPPITLANPLKDVDSRVFTRMLRKDGSVTISLCNFIGEGIIMLETDDLLFFTQICVSGN